MNDCTCKPGGVCPYARRIVTPREQYICQHSEHHRKAKQEKHNASLAIIESTATLSASLVSVVSSMIQWARSGFKLRYSEKRHKQCSTCPGRVWFYFAWRCRPCGCFLWLKTRMPHESCPAGLWGPKPITQPSIDPVTGQLVQVKIVSIPPGKCGCGK